MLWGAMEQGLKRHALVEPDAANPARDDGVQACIYLSFIWYVL